MRTRSLLISLVIAAAPARAATMPDEFDDGVRSLSPLFAYFGGVANITIAPSASLVHSGGSEAVTIFWQPDANFSMAGAAVGDRLISGADLDVPPDAAWCSVSIDAPPAGVVSLEIVLREDDNADGIIDPLTSDDEWRAARFFLSPGPTVYNIALADFFDANAEGDGVQGFATTGAIAIELIIETNAAYPGGALTSAATYHFDHLGLFASAQTLPPSRPADLNGDGLVDGADLGLLLSAWGACPANCAGDLNGDSAIDGADVGILLGGWTPAAS